MFVPLLLAFEEIAVFLQERNSLHLSGDFFFLPPQEAQISSETPAKTKVSNHKLKCLGQLRFYHQNKIPLCTDTVLIYTVRKLTFASRILFQVFLWKGESLIFFKLDTSARNLKNNCNTALFERKSNRKMLLFQYRQFPGLAEGYSEQQFTTGTQSSQPLSPVLTSLSPSTQAF